MRRKLILIAVIVSCFGRSVSWAQDSLHRVVVRNFDELKAYFKYDPAKPVIISSGHRGGMLPYFPENSLEAMEKTLSILPSFFEIDPVLTKDSVMVLMHDPTLDRTSTLKGKVSDYTYDQLKAARLKDRQGNITPYKIPTLEEALEWGKDKTIFNLDNKGIPWQKYVDLLKAKPYPNIVLSVRSMKEALFYYERLDKVLLCVAIKNQKDLDDFIATKIPFDRLVAYVGYTMSPEHAGVYKYLRDRGVMIFISIHPTQDRKKTDLEKVKGYSEELIKRPDIIETDYPALFINEKEGWIVKAIYPKRSRPVSCPAEHGKLPRPKLVVGIIVDQMRRDYLCRYDDLAGNWITSTYYMPDLPAWVKAFNDRKLAAKYLQQGWITRHGQKNVLG